MRRDASLSPPHYRLWALAVSVATTVHSITPFAGFQNCRTGILCYRQLGQLSSLSCVTNLSSVSIHPVLQTTYPAFQFIMCYRQLVQLFNSTCLQTTCPAFQFNLSTHNLSSFLIQPVYTQLVQLFNSTCLHTTCPAFQFNLSTHNLLSYSVPTAPRTAPSPCVRMLQEAVTLRG